MHTIEIKNLTKKIKGIPVLSDINLNMQSGKTYGLIGKNGSGKTMLLRVIAGLMKPSSGSIIYNQKELYNDIDYIDNLGLIIENIGLYPEFTGFKNLKLLAEINKKITDSDIRNTIIRVGLNPEDKRTVKKYSLGMRQRITLAQAIMEKPDVLLLDEPTNGLDEKGIELLRNICKEEQKRNIIIIIASHSSDDIDILCDEVYKMENGMLSIIERK